MTSKIYKIDFNAHNGTSFLHRCSPWAKVVLFLVLLGAAISSRSLGELSVLFAFTVFLWLAAGLSPWDFITWLRYPAAFSLVFALSQLSIPALAIQTIGRGITAASASLLLLNTTSYLDIFSLLGVVSSTISNFMFLTYRFFFLLVVSLDTRVAVLRLRGGRGLRHLGSFANVIGLTFIESIEKAERIYSILKVRGYRGKLSHFSRLSFGLPEISVLLLTAMAALLRLMA